MGDLKIIVAIYLKDIFLFSKNTKESNLLQKQLNSEFDIKNLGKAKSILSMRSVCDKNNAYLNKKSHIEKLLYKFNWNEWVPVDILYAAGKRLGKEIGVCAHS